MCRANHDFGRDAADIHAGTANLARLDHRHARAPLGGADGRGRGGRARADDRDMQRLTRFCGRPRAHLKSWSVHGPGACIHIGWSASTRANYSAREIGAVRMAGVFSNAFSIRVAQCRHAMFVTWLLSRQLHSFLTALRNFKRCTMVRSQALDGSRQDEAFGHAIERRWEIEHPATMKDMPMFPRSRSCCLPS